MASYRVEVSRKVRQEIGRLPGNMRQRVLRALRALEQAPRPHDSRPLDLDKTEIVLEEGLELRRIRMASWRIVYFVDDDWALITVLAIRKRPPYQYDDLEELIQDS